MPSPNGAAASVSDPPQDTAPGIRLDGLRVSYGGQPLLSIGHASFTGGRLTCLLGVSGIGKSTLLRGIAGLTRGDGGTIEASDRLPLAGRLAYLAQDDALLPWASVIENTMIGSRLRGEAKTPSQVERAMALLAQVGLDRWAHSLPGVLSGGMRQRVALARTLYENAPVVLMDEPFSALDAITRSQLQELTCRLLAGRTVIMVTHDPLEALRMADHIVLLAGQPASLGQQLDPAGDTPRDTGNAEIWQHHAWLLDQLRRAT